MKSFYRPEIDGLRAVAVLSVVLYHAGYVVDEIPMASGGFLGVDVFFVISGYLIASIVLREVDNGSFSFGHFYERRVRRLLPVLFVVVAATSFAAWKYMLPKSLVDFSWSGLSALAFVSNFWFWQEDLYTADASQLKPLLHSWSLAVEEQFYLIFPLLTVFLWKFLGRYLLVSFAFLLIFSFLGAHDVSAENPGAAFYLFPFRAWEPLVGVCLAKIEFDHGRKNSAFLAQCFSLLGLLAILAATVVYDDTARHPSFPTLFPVLGAALVIWFATPGSLVGRLLSSKPFVGVGLISYSLYLWHFPLLAIARRIDPSVSDFTITNLICLSFVLSVLTYFLIEKPFRNAVVINKRHLWYTTSISLLLLMMVNASIVSQSGFPQRLGVVTGLFDNLSARYPPHQIDCITENGRWTCSEIPIEGLNIVVVGDSHAQSLSDIDAGLPRLADKLSGTFTGLYYPGCPMITGTHKWYAGHEDKACHEYSKKVDRFLANQKPLTIVYNARLPQYFEGGQFDNGEGGKDSAIPFHVTVEQDSDPDPDALMNAIDQTLRRWLSYGHDLIIVYPTPEAGWDIPKIVKAKLDQVDANNKLALFQSLDFSTDYRVIRNRNARSNEVLDKLPDAENLFRIIPERHVCSKETMRCQTHDKFGLLYLDSNHFSIYGARPIIQEIEKIL